MLDQGDVNGQDDGSVAAGKHKSIVVLACVNVRDRIEEVLHVSSVCFILQNPKIMPQLHDIVSDEPNGIFKHFFIRIHT